MFLLCQQGFPFPCRLGATEQQEVSSLAKATQKLAKTNRQKNVLNESERNYVSGGVPAVGGGTSVLRPTVAWETMYTVNVANSLWVDADYQRKLKTAWLDWQDLGDFKNRLRGIYE